MVTHASARDGQSQLVRLQWRRPAREGTRTGRALPADSRHSAELPSRDRTPTGPGAASLRSRNRGRGVWAEPDPFGCGRPGLAALVWLSSQLPLGFAVLLCSVSVQAIRLALSDWLRGGSGWVGPPGRPLFCCAAHICGSCGEWFWERRIWLPYGPEGSPNAHGGRSTAPPPAARRLPLALAVCPGQCHPSVAAVVTGVRRQARCGPVTVIGAAFLPPGEPAADPSEEVLGVCSGPCHPLSGSPGRRRQMSDTAPPRRIPIRGPSRRAARRCRDRGRRADVSSV